MKNVTDFSKEIRKDLKETNTKATETITIRVTSDEKKRVKRLAKACKISQTQLIKKLIQAQISKQFRLRKSTRSSKSFP